MNLYRIWQTTNQNDYDYFSAAIVAAESEEDARLIHPTAAGSSWGSNKNLVECWAKPEDVRVELLGTAKKGTKAGVIQASFCAG